MTILTVAGMTAWSFLASRRAAPAALLSYPDFYENRDLSREL